MPGRIFDFGCKLTSANRGLRSERLRKSRGGGQEIFGMKKYTFSRCTGQKPVEKKKFRVRRTRETETLQYSQPKRRRGVSDIKMLTTHHTNVHCPPQCVAASPSGSALPRVWPERVAVSRYYERGSNATYLLHFCFPLRLGLKLPFLLFPCRFSEEHLELTWSDRSLALRASFSCS